MLNTIKQFPISNGESRRFDCPFCGGKNTLSISKQLGKLQWCCFRASCNTRGISDYTLSKEELIKSFTKEKRDFFIPDYFTSPLSNEDAVKYLKRNNCLKAYVDKLADIWYDPKEHRIVFGIKWKGKRYGAIGKKLGANSVSISSYSRWYRYSTSNISTPFSIVVESNMGSVILVEDCASACNAATIINSVALLGTNLTDAYKNFIVSNFTSFVIALDKDASVKAIQIQRQLKCYGQTDVLFLNKDIKYWNEEELKCLRNLL